MFLNGFYLPVLRLFLMFKSCKKNLLTRHHYVNVSNGLAPYASGQNYFCVPTNKPAEFEVKNRSKSVEEAKTEHFCSLLYFRYYYSK